MRQWFVVGALLALAVGCGSSHGDAPSAAADGGPTDPTGDAEAIVDAGPSRPPALDASCINYALRFNGDQWLSVPDSPVLDDLGSFTLEAWIGVDAPVAPAPAQTHVLAHRDPADQGGYDFVVNDSLQPGLHVFGSSGAMAAVGGGAPSALRATELTHVAITYDPAGKAAVFVDGTRTAETAAPISVVGNANGELRIGGSTREASEGFHGLIDEIRISKGIRYTADFVRPSNALEADGTTVALWPFDEGEDVTAADSSKNKLTATMPMTPANQPLWLQVACVSQLSH